ncbi:sugar ABC transporter substrate-binding protein [Lactococcus piscium]|uniref:ABC transporter n=1 Tax=Pseudolactococcus carnosus TaxID=2749961 RepID=UPI001FB94614|nr:ABC transporter [Lactococcus carnosus]MCJ1974471.1 sugar ABC transporter substrate-binding protein [Lactococcus carnosus]MCJ1982381.1 sugar ABC transporter substrate-binding protein [Lactococcus carnosus]MCJ1984712.1 sugar ABC transporter substrate-binding protein [Lactococcus carnosus]MCJ1992100.1 sugar ABC transporter substrate-binding protein [Lactococcus carnosus]
MATFKKKLISGIMLGAAVLAFAACGKKDDNAETTTDGKTIITLGRQTAVDPKLPKGDTYNSNAYTRAVDKKFNIKIKDKFEANGDDYKRQVSLAIASGDIPDMMVVSRDEMKELYDNDLIEDMTAVYKDTGSKAIKEAYQSYKNRPIEDGTFDKKLMGLPATAGDLGPSLFWVRDDWTQKLGIKLDADGNGAITIDELHDLAKTFAEKNPGGTAKNTGIAIAPTVVSGSYGGSGYSAMGIGDALGSHPGFWIKGADGKIVNGTVTKETKDTLTLLNSWYKEGILDKQFGTRTWDDISAMMVNGETGIISGPWHIPDWNLFQAKEKNKDVSFKAYALENAQGKVETILNNPTGNFVVVRKGFKKPELAMKIINFIYDDMRNSPTAATDYPEIAAYHASAVDGSTRPFNIEINPATELLDTVSDAKAVLDGQKTENDVKYPDTRSLIKTLQTYSKDPAAAKSTDWATYTSRIFGVNDVLVKVRNEGLLTEVDSPFFGNTKTLEEKGADMDKLREETFMKMITGAKPLSDFDNFVKQWNKQGGAQVTQEVQKAVDAK